MYSALFLHDVHAMPHLASTIPRTSLVSAVQSLPRLATLTIHGELHPPTGADGPPVDEALECAMAAALPRLGMLCTSHGRRDGERLPQPAGQYTVARKAVETG
jgi:hypothetical protein